MMMVRCRRVEVQNEASPDPARLKEARVERVEMVIATSKTCIPPHTLPFKFSCHAVRQSLYLIICQW